MAKRFFRFLRGELTGKYVQAISRCLDKNAYFIYSLYNKMVSFQFDKEHLDKDFTYNIGKITGVFVPRLSLNESYGGIRLTDSFIIGGVERSERGLFDTEEESFKLKHTEQDNYAQDINTLSNNALRTSFVEENKRPIGYIRSDEKNVFTDEGEVDLTKVKTIKPEGVAYADFYGNQYLFIIDSENERHSINLEVYFYLIQSMQYVRYNGANLGSLFKAAEILCPKGLLEIISIVYNESRFCFDFIYRLNKNVSLSKKEERFFAFKLLLKFKFKQFNLIEKQ